MYFQWFTASTPQLRRDSSPQSDQRIEAITPIATFPQAGSCTKELQIIRRESRPTKMAWAIAGEKGPPIAARSTPAATQTRRAAAAARQRATAARQPTAASKQRAAVEEGDVSLAANEASSHGGGGLCCYRIVQRVAGAVSYIKEGFIIFLWPVLDSPLTNRSSSVAFIRAFLLVVGLTLLLGECPLLIEGRAPITRHRNGLWGAGPPALQPRLRRFSSRSAERYFSHP